MTIWLIEFLFIVPISMEDLEFLRRLNQFRQGAHLHFLLPVNEVRLKVMFLHLLVCSQGGGGWLPSMYHRSNDKGVGVCIQVERGVCIQGVCSQGELCMHPGGWSLHPGGGSLHPGGGSLHHGGPGSSASGSAFGERGVDLPCQN